MVIVRDAHLRRRAWAAWHGGLVARGRIHSFDELLPQHLVPMTAGERAAARERRNLHNLKLWAAVFVAAGEKGT